MESETVEFTGGINKVPSKDDEDEQPIIRKRRISRIILPKRPRKKLGQVQFIADDNSDALTEDSSGEENEGKASKLRRRLRNHNGPTNMQHEDTTVTKLTGNGAKRKSVDRESTKDELDDSDGALTSKKFKKTHSYMGKMKHLCSYFLTVCSFFSERLIILLFFDPFTLRGRKSPLEASQNQILMMATFQIRKE